MEKTIDEIQGDIVGEFEMLGDDWQDKYQYIMDMGRSLPDFPEEERVEANKVRGCQSNVWLISGLDGENINFRGDSDALIVKGLVALLLRVFNGRRPDEILAAKLDFLEEIGLQQHLSPTRNNGLAAMIKQIKFYALAYKSKMQN